MRQGDHISKCALRCSLRPPSQPLSNLYSHHDVYTGSIHRVRRSRHFKRCTGSIDHARRACLFQRKGQQEKGWVNIAISLYVRSQRSSSLPFALYLLQSPRTTTPFLFLCPEMALVPPLRCTSYRGSRQVPCRFVSTIVFSVSYAPTVTMRFETHSRTSFALFSHSEQRHRCVR
jgi:hypothetical protein